MYLGEFLFDILYLFKYLCLCVNSITYFLHTLYYYVFYITFIILSWLNLDFIFKMRILQEETVCLEKQKFFSYLCETM